MGEPFKFILKIIFYVLVKYSKNFLLIYYQGAVVPVRRSDKKFQLGNSVSEGRTSSIRGGSRC